MFDVQQIRADQTQDSAGHALPLNVSQGQFKWAIHGATGGKIALIGRAEMVSRSQDISSSYSCPMDCGPTYDVQGTFSGDLFSGQQGFASVTEIAYWNYGYMMGPYPVSASWSADYPLVTFDPSDSSSTSITPVDAGQVGVTGFVGWYDRYDWDGLNCVYLGTYENAIDAILDILLAVDFLDVRLVNTNRVAAFEPLLNTANLNMNTTEPPAACSGDNFAIKARFHLPNQSASCCNNGTTSFVILPNGNKFHFVGAAYEFYGNDDPPYVIVYLKRNLDGSGTGNSVRIRVGGHLQNGEPYSGQGTVHLVCP